MFRRHGFPISSDVWSAGILRWRGRILIATGHVLRDEFLKLAGRYDLWEARRRPLPGTLRR
jgi:hypothetical protein